MRQVQSNKQAYICARCVVVLVASCSNVACPFTVPRRLAIGDQRVGDWGGCKQRSEQAKANLQQRGSSVSWRRSRFRMGRCSKF